MPFADELVDVNVIAPEAQAARVVPSKSTLPLASSAPDRVKAVRLGLLVQAGAQLAWWIIFPFVPLASLPGALAPEAYSISPAVVRTAGAVTRKLFLMWVVIIAAVTTSPVVQQRGAVQAIKSS
jgi:hypothetical protein